MTEALETVRTFRKHYYMNDTYEDSILFSKLLSEY